MKQTFDVTLRITAETCYPMSGQSVSEEIATELTISGYDVQDVSAVEVKRQIQAPLR